MSPKSGIAGDGLEDIIAAPSSICSIEGGVLRYRGINIHELAQQSNFEEVVYLLWYGKLPNAAELKKLQADLEANAQIPEAVMKLLREMPKKANFMDVLRTAVSVLGLYDPEAEDNSAESNQRKALRLTAQMGTLVAAWEHLRNQREPIHPKKGLSLAANFLYMLRGKEASELEVRAFDQALVLHADHEFNASTFCARVTASTLTDMYSAITSAVGTLKGPLHGGANTKVMETLLKIGEPSNVTKYLDDAFAKKERIMGFGHRVYKDGDPRAVELKKMSEALGKEKGETKWFEMSKQVEAYVKEKKALLPNVDFYSASVYYSMNIPFDVYTPIFAISRVSGWTAHVVEQLTNNRLLRPRAEYEGVKEASYVPLSKRS
jgi:citrate synthase